MKIIVKKLMILAIVGVIFMSLVACGSKAKTVTAPIPAVTASNEWNLKNKTVIDLSHVQDQTMPADPALKKPTLEFFSRVGQNGALHNLEVISYCPHTGTHLDAPFHVNNNGGAVETLDPTVLIGPASVINLNVPAGSYAITAADIKSWEAKNGPIQEGDGVLIHTGHDKNWPNKDTYIDKGYPYLAKDAADLKSQKNPFCRYGKYLCRCSDH